MIQTLWVQFFKQDSNQESKTIIIFYKSNGIYFIFLKDLWYNVYSNWKKTLSSKNLTMSNPFDFGRVIFCQGSNQQLKTIDF